MTGEGRCDGNFPQDSTSPRGGRPLVEAGLKLRVRDLRGRFGFFVTHTLNAADGTTVRFRLDVGAAYGWIRFEHHRADRAWADPGYDISIAAVKQPLGGLKWHFHCPQSGKPCNVLHMPVGGYQFASRQAHGLAFMSQRLRAPARAAVRAQRIRLDLGGSAGLEAPFPERPRGMHGATYQRRRNVGIKAEAAET